MPTARRSSAIPRTTFVCGSLGLIALFALAAGCAPIGAYRGPAPVHPHTSSRIASATPDSTVVIVYGDNRPGYMVMSRSVGASVVRASMLSNRPSEWLRGLIHVPIAVLQLVFPTLDGIRDLWARHGSHRFTGGNEIGVLRALVAERDVDLVVNTGDLVEDGRRGGQWSDFAKRHESLRASTPFHAIPGNHERTWHPLGQANWDTVIGSPAGPSRTWHHVDVGPARFVLMDTSPLTDPREQFDDAAEQTLSEAQLAWADSILAEPFPYKFVALHYPLVTSGHHADDWRPDDVRTPSRRGRMLEMFDRHGVTAVFAGHEHLYERTWIGSRDGRRGFWHITTGGGGSPLYRISEERRTMALAQTLPGGYRIGFPAEEQSVYHFCRLVVREPAQAQAGGLPGIALEVRRVDGNHATRTIDHVDLSRPFLSSR
jgi:hypothetical protein